MLSGPPGEYGRKVETFCEKFSQVNKLKGIGGGAHKGWRMRFNWI